MNKQGRQKFLTLFNEMLTDRKGLNALETALQMNQKGDDVENLHSQKEQDMSVRMDQRNILFLKKVEEAKQKILEGSYGECEDCGDTISQRRLLARPTASMCIGCQEEKEREDLGNFNKRRDLTSKKFKEENLNDHIVERAKYGSLSDIAFESVVDL